MPMISKIQDTGGSVRSKNADVGGKGESFTLTEEMIHMNEMNERDETKSVKGRRSIHNQRIDIDKSKLARNAGAFITTVNWHEMAKVLFWADQDPGRRLQVDRLVPKANPTLPTDTGTSYNTEQAQYLLLVMLVLMAAENKSRQMYHEEFEKRCDAISSAHGLKDEQYWATEGVPSEWTSLSEEFNQRSHGILVETLRTYGLNEVADLIQNEGPSQFLNAIQKLEGQFLNILEHASWGLPAMSSEGHGSLPEMLQQDENDDACVSHNLDPKPA